MITLEILLVRIEGLDRAQIELWIARDWLRPAGTPEAWLFDDIDVARLHLIRQLRGDLQVQEEAIPVVLGLVDQMYETRRQLRRMCEALDRAVPVISRDAIWQAMTAADP